MENSTLSANKRKVNPNLIHLVKSLREGKRGVVLEGSSRSGKTWSGIDFIIYLCTKVETNCTINIVRATYNSFKTTLYQDFNRRFPDFGLASPFADVQERSTFKLFGNQINLIGGDKPSKLLGAGCDYLFINEALPDVTKELFDQAEMRCRKFWWMDYNPSLTKSWVYDSVIKRDTVSYLRTTYVNNPFISKNEREKILSYNPNDKKNIEQGTADEYMWKVYGLGERAQREGLIYKNWTTGKFPEHLPFIWLIDWGSNDEFTLSKMAINNKTMQIFVKNEIYLSDQNSKSIWKHVRNHCRPSTRFEEGDLIICDNQNKTGINDLIDEGFNAIPCVKENVVYGIKRVQSYQIVSCDSPHLEDELNNYIWLEDKAGIPIPKHDHILDCIRYFEKYVNG